MCLKTLVDVYHEHMKQARVGHSLIKICDLPRELTVCFQVLVCFFFLDISGVYIYDF